MTPNIVLNFTCTTEGWENNLCIILMERSKKYFQLLSCEIYFYTIDPTSYVHKKIVSFMVQQWFII